MLQALTDGILTGGVYAMASLGLALIFGIMKITNFAHGACLTLGMYIVYIASNKAGLGFGMGLVMAAVVMFGVGYIFCKLMPKESLANSEGTLLLTLGISYILENAILCFMGSDYKSVANEMADNMIKIGKISVRESKLEGFVLSVVVFVALYVFLYKTKTGLAMRGCAEDRLGGGLCGVDTRRITALAFAIGIGCTALSGGVLTSMMSIFPTAGETVQLKCFQIAVLGGMGNLSGVFPAAIIIGVVESVVSYYFGGSAGLFAVYLLFVAVILIRPYGLAGKANRRGDSEALGKTNIKAMGKNTKTFISKLSFCGTDILELFKSKKIPVVFAVLFILSGAVLPVAGGKYLLRNGILVLITAILAHSWREMTRKMGLFSFGHCLFFGIGAYCCAFLYTEYSVPVVVGFMIGMVISAIVSGMICFISEKYKMQGDYFAIATLAFAEMVRVAVNSGSFMGGAKGIVIPLEKGDDPLLLRFDGDVCCYFIILFFFAVLCLATAFINKSSFGMRLFSIKGHVGAAESLGVDVMANKIYYGALCGAVAGAAGGFYAVVYGYIDPSVVFSPSVSVSAIVSALLGGEGIPGCLTGAFISVGLKEVCTELLPGYSGVCMMIYGLIITLYASRRRLK